jgi:hypothetical protein
MFKSTSAALVALLILSSTAFAATKCSAFTVAGSYVRQTSPYIDQLMLNVDGTAYWFNSGAFDRILLGTSSPEVGSWTCLADGTVLVTTIGSNYLQNSPYGDIPQPGQPLDINLANNVRLTQKLTIVDVDTLQQIDRIVKRIALSNDPLGPGALGSSSCFPLGNPCDPAPYKRIRPQPTDIP